MTELQKLNLRATQGKWGQYSPKYMEEAKGSDKFLWDTSHDTSCVKDGLRSRIATFKHASDAAFAETLVNLYRNGTLVVIT
ncbi:MAG: hypothetical protein COA52_00425 [Hyphomicrobiales bacterium]|nr:MAG: hypothetical protein COA52_00425 [Hyphomicrobiales bacterium]